MLNPPITSLTEVEIEPVVEIIRTSIDLGDANRTLRQEYPQWDLAQRLAALRAGQNRIFNDWQKSPSRKSRASLAHAHAGERYQPKEDAP